jgi:NAD(P)-dependent dehydrogenase (short-subunit alcohol dehydrogenase family)
MGGIDMLGKNPGGEASDKGFRSWLEVTPKEWRSTYNSNVVSMIRFIRLAVPAMREAGWSGILNNRPPSLCR